jgi:hypothetical protein
VLLDTGCNFTDRQKAAHRTLGDMMNQTNACVAMADVVAVRGDVPQAFNLFNDVTRTIL